MSASAHENERVVILSDAELTAPSRALNGEKATLVEAAQRGEETLVELHRRLSAESAVTFAVEPLDEWIAALDRASGPVRIAPFSPRFAYGWVVVALGANCPAVDEVAQAVARTAPGLTGLVLSAERFPDVRDDIDVLSPDTAPVFAEEQAGLAQVARAVLGTIPPTRVLVTDSVGAALGEVLERHTLAVAIDRDERGAVDVGGSAWDALRALATGSMPADPSWRQNAVEVLVVSGDSEEVAPLPGGSTVAWSASSAAAFLSPGWVDASLPRPVAGRSPASIVERTIGSKGPREGGRRVAFASLHLLGDTLAATAVLRAYRERYPADHVSLLVPDASYARVLELCPAVDCVAYLELPDDRQIVFEHSRPIVEALPWWRNSNFDERFVLDVQEIARDGLAGELHMAELHARRVGLELQNLRPCIDVERSLAHRPASAPEEPYIVLARHTVSGKHALAREAKTKRWAERRWLALAARIRRELGLTIVSIGTPAEARLDQSDVLNFHDLDIRQVAGLLAGADALVTVDNGILHLGLGLDVPLVHLQPNWLPQSWTASSPSDAYRNLHVSLPRLGVARVFDSLNDILARRPSANLRRRVPRG